MWRATSEYLAYKYKVDDGGIISIVSGVRGSSSSECGGEEGINGREKEVEKRRRRREVEVITAW